VPDSLFDEINGVAADIEAWQNLIWGSKPEFQHSSLRRPERGTASLVEASLPRRGPTNYADGASGVCLRRTVRSRR